MSRAERSGWRDEDLSRRHRLYGVDVPATDVDFLMIEYDHHEAVGVVDYKLRDNIGFAKPEHFNTVSSVRAMCSLCDSRGRQLPVFVAMYERDPWRYRLLSENPRADAMMARQFGKCDILLTEIEYVEWLYLIRRRTLPTFVMKRLQEEDTG